jgi:hypothetical protein
MTTAGPASLSNWPHKRTALALSAAGLTVSLADPLDQVADDLGDEPGILPVQVVATVVCHDMCV